MSSHVLSFYVDTCFHFSQVYTGKNKIVGSHANCVFKLPHCQAVLCVPTAVGDSRGSSHPCQHRLSAFSVIVILVGVKCSLSLIFNMGNSYLFSFYPDQSRQKFIHFIELLREPAFFGLIDFLYCFSVFCFIDSCSDLYYFSSDAYFGSSFS